MLTGPVNLSLDTFRAAASSPSDEQAGLVTAPSVPTNNLIDTPKGARFVPLLKEEQPAETNNRATFVQQHEFGVQLRSDF